jgi:hypothetical protein
MIDINTSIRKVRLTVLKLFRVLVLSICYIHNEKVKIMVFVNE